MKKFITLTFTSLIIIILGAPLTFAVSDATKSLNELGKQTGQSGYEKSEAHDQASRRTGAESITSAFLNIGDYIVLITSSIAVLYFIVAFVKLITAGDKIDDEISKQKNNIKWIILGLVLIVLADEIIFDVFFGAETGSPTQPGKGFESTSSIGVVARELGKEVSGIINAVDLYVVYLAVLVIVISGMRLIVQSGNEEATAKAKKHIGIAAIGLIVIGLAEGLVYVVYPEPDKPFDIETAYDIIINMTLFITSFISFLSVSVIMYAGYLYIFYYGQDDMVEKAKKIIKSGVISLIISSLAYGIVSTAISLDWRPEEQEVITFE